jgi:hypothetical protein
MKDIIIIDHVSHFGKDPHYTDKDHALNLLHKLAKDLKRTQIRKEKIKKILCQD